MTLSGLDIFKLLPKTNCKECGYATCLAFAMALAQKKTSLDKCPTVTEEAKAALESASQPPIKLVTIGVGDSRLEIGNETVMYRHEQKFYHPTVIGILVEDSLNEQALEARLNSIKALSFERVGIPIKPELVCIRNSSGNKEAFLKAVNRAVSVTGRNIALLGDSAQAIEPAAKAIKDKRPLLVSGGGRDVDGFIKIAKENSLPIAITCSNLEEASSLTDKIKKAGVDEIVINFTGDNISKKVQLITYARRSALKKNFRPLGYPVIAFTSTGDEGFELAEAVTYVTKYAGIVVVRNIDKEFILPLLVTRQDIYTDPQKPVQVEPKVYEIGKVGPGSPVIVTTNFSITYFTVAGEVEASKVPTYMICADADGMSVLTAWAAEKFTAEKIAGLLKNGPIAGMVGHKKIIIPGYVSVLSGKLEEESGWKVIVGPREASGIPVFLRNYR
jgi:acetyl-CoA decarbonylase/synthase, CODH/ACS complex subunit gamma